MTNKTTKVNKIKLSQLELESNLKEEALIPIVQDNNTKAIKSKDLFKEVNTKIKNISNREIEFQTNNGYMQWKYKNDTTWNNLISMNSLKGEQGIPGQDGVTPNIAVGTVTTLEAGEQAIVTREGTKENIIFNFGIPKGESGVNSSVSNNASIEDSIIASDKTWSSSKIEDFVLTNDDVIWSTIQGENLSVNYTKEGYLRKVEIFGNTVQGFADCVTSEQIVEAILSTGLDNKARLNNDGTFTVDHHGFSFVNWNEVNKEGFIQLEPNTEYSICCWRDNGAYPGFTYTLYEETRTIDCTGATNSTFSTGSSGKVLLYPVNAQDGKLKVRVVKGDYNLKDYPYDYNLSDIQHLGELYVDEKGDPILDKEDRKQYKIEIKSKNASHNLVNLSNLAHGKDIDYSGNLVNKISDTICLDFIPVSQGDIIFMSGGLWKKIIGYDKNKKYIDRLYDNSDGTNKYTIPKGVAFIRLGWGSPDLNTTKANKIMFVFGDKQLPYEETYVSYDKRVEKKETLLLPCQLMKIGEISDRLYWDGSKGRYVIEKRIKEIILNGQEDWRYAGNRGVGYIHEYCIHNKVEDTARTDSNKPTTMAEGYKGVTDSPYFNSNTANSCMIYNQNITIGDMVIDNVSSLKNKLILKNIKFYYQLATSQLIDTNIREQLLLPSYKDKTHLFVTGGIDGSIKVKAPVDGGKVITVLENRNTELKVVNDVQDELINTTMLAIDEMFMMLEPLMIDLLNEQSSSRMVDMYVAMVQKELKKIDDVPQRYKTQIKETLAQTQK